MPRSTRRSGTSMLLYTKKDDALVATLEQTAQAPAGRSPWADARGRFLRNRAAVASLIVLVLVTLLCVFGPMVLPYEFDTADWDAMKLPPSMQGHHFWGTDESGRDLLVRCLIDGRISLMVGVLATI